MLGQYYANITVVAGPILRFTEEGRFRFSYFLAQTFLLPWYKKNMISRKSATIENGLKCHLPRPLHEKKKKPENQSKIQGDFLKMACPLRSAVFVIFFVLEDYYCAFPRGKLPKTTYINITLIYIDFI